MSDRKLVARRRIVAGRRGRLGTPGSDRRAVPPTSGPPDGDGRGPSAGGRRRRAVRWIAAAVLTAVIGSVVTINTDAVKSWWADRHPVDSQVSPGTEKLHSWFSLVVPDPARVPPEAAGITDCDAMWRLGLAAGGIPTGEALHRMVLRGAAKDTATITDVRARVTQRGPAADGALLECPSAGSANPTVLQFDLSKGDVASPTKVDPRDPDTARVNQFGDGFVISLKENEVQPLALDTVLPDDSIRWHLEADVWVGGTLRTIVLDDNGRDFYSPGRRPANRYRAGHGAGVETTDWGVDPSPRPGRSPAGTEQLEFDGLAVPALPGLDLYQPQLTGDGVNTRYRWLRRDGRKLLSLNPPGAAPEAPLREGGNCQASEVDESSTQPYGVVRTATVRSRETRSHEGQAVEDTTVDYRCSTDGGAGPRRDGAFGTPAYFTCGRVLCPEFPITVRTVHLVGSGTVFTARSTEVADEDRPTVDQILDDVRTTAATSPDVGAPTSEPVVPLAPGRYPPVPGIDGVTDVARVTDAWSDSRGVVVEFDEVEYAACACPAGHLETNVNPRVRRVRLGGDATILTWYDEGGRSQRGSTSVSSVAGLAGRHALVVLTRTPDGTALAVGEV